MTPKKTPYNHPLPLRYKEKHSKFGKNEIKPGVEPQTNEK